MAWNDEKAVKILTEEVWGEDRLGMTHEQAIIAVQELRARGELSELESRM